MSAGSGRYGSVALQLCRAPFLLCPLPPYYPTALSPCLSPLSPSPIKVPAAFRVPLRPVLSLFPHTNCFIGKVFEPHLSLELTSRRQTTVSWCRRPVVVSFPSLSSRARHFEDALSTTAKPLTNLSPSLPRSTAKTTAALPKPQGASSP